MSNPELEATVQAETVRSILERTIDTDAATIERRPGDTIRPKTADPTRSAEGALSLLASRAGNLELEGTLGEGGMGVVRLGTQASLGRKVAIKTLKGDRRDQPAVIKLLREAWVTGSLEHPNILPIHDVRLDEDGLPLVVLKRIEGIDWIEVMRDPEAMEERFGAGDLLANNLHVWTQVCRAIAFAHSRGIVHRDIKPENVRIGEFGEVIVLDWGLAVALSDDGTGRFPQVANATEMAGTPCYMGPEMLGEDDPPRITERTDVYLLGAVLYEITCGRPPHIGANALAILTSVLKSKPSFDADTPEELAAIIERAMQADPADRFASVDELRLAVAGFVEHRGSMALAQQAMARLERLEQVLERGGDDSERRVHAYDLFGECRFGFAEALNGWPDNPLAREGMRRGLERMIELELARGDARAARRFLEQLTSPDPELDKRVERGVAEQEEAERRRAEGEKLVRELDKSIGTRTRTFISVVFGVAWTVGPLVVHFVFHEQAKSTHWVAACFCTAALLLSSGLFVWARESMTKTAVNRRMAATVMVMLLAQLALTGMAAMVGFRPMQTWTLLLFVWALTAGLAAANLDRRLVPTAIVQAVAFVTSAVHVDDLFLIMTVANVLTTINFFVIWRPERWIEPKAES